MKDRTQDAFIMGADPIVLGIASQQESLLNFLVQRSHFLTYEKQVSEYDAFASISLLLIARLSFDENVPLRIAVDVLKKDEKWADLGAYIVKCADCQVLENIWLDFCKLVLPNNQDTLYEVYCRALNIVAAGRSQIGLLYLPQRVISQICSVVIRNESDRVLNLACGEGAIVADIIRSGYHKNDIFAVESNPAKVFISKVRVFLNGGVPTKIFCADGLIETKDLHEQCYDVIITNPPFGKRYPVYLTRSWLFRTSDLRFHDVEYYETAYLIRSLELLKPGGRLAIFVPDHVLCKETWSNLRKEVTKHADVLAVVSFAQNAIIGNYGSIQKSLLLLRKKRLSTGSGEIRTCFGIVGHLDRGGCQPILGFDDFIESFKLNKSRCESKSLFWRSIDNNEMWLPRAIIADEEFRNTYRVAVDKKIGNFLRQVDCVRTSETEDDQYFLVHDIDGIRKGVESFRVRRGGQVIRPYKVAEANNLLVTYKSGCLLVGVVPKECEGLVLDRYSQMFSPLGYASGCILDCQVPRIMEMLFSSLKYRRYLKDRFVASVWKDDFVNYFVPMVQDRRKCAFFLEKFEQLKARKTYVIDEMMARLHSVEDAYKMRTQTMGRNAAGNIENIRRWPLVRLGNVVRLGKGDVVGGEGVLRGLEVDENIIDKVYLSAVLMSNVSQLRIEDELWQRTSHGYSQYLLDKIVLLLPDIQTQKEFASRVENSIAEFNILLRELCKLRRDTSFSRLIDEELICED